MMVKETVTVTSVHTARVIKCEVEGVNDVYFDIDLSQVLNACSERQPNEKVRINYRDIERLKRCVIAVQLEMTKRV